MREAIPVDEEGVIAREDDFCRERWPRRVNGQWNQIRALCEEIGVWRLFEATHRLLVAGGWGPEFVSWNAERSERSWIQSQREKVSYYSREDKGAPMVRLLLHRSSENELVFLILEGDAELPLDQRRLARVTNTAEAADFVNRLQSGS